MYNLIVTGLVGRWDGSAYELEVSRVVREYTDEAISERFRSLDQAAVSALMSFPALFAYEEVHKADARLGFLTRIRSRLGQVRFEYQLYPDLPPILASRLNDLRWELDIQKLELNRTHWAVKDVDLLPTLVDAGLLSREQVSGLPEHQVHSFPEARSAPLLVSPTVFSVPAQHGPEPDLVSVMMPFEAPFDAAYAAIQRACATAGLRCLRADNIWQESVVIQDIFNLLIRSRIVIVDFSRKNANVMYETGIAHTLGRPVIPLAQSIEDVPFDVRHHRVLLYLPNTEGLATMEAKLTERLRTLHALIQRAQ